MECRNIFGSNGSRTSIPQPSNPSSSHRSDGTIPYFSGYLPCKHSSAELSFSKVKTSCLYSHQFQFRSKLNVQKKNIGSSEMRCLLRSFLLCKSHCLAGNKTPSLSIGRDSNKCVLICALRCSDLCGSASGETGGGCDLNSQWRTLPKIAFDTMAHNVLYRMFNLKVDLF